MVDSSSATLAVLIIPSSRVTTLHITPLLDSPTHRAPTERQSAVLIHFDRPLAMMRSETLQNGSSNAGTGTNYLCSC